MPITLKRAYEDPSPEDGHRVLVDRLWPRGISKENARLDEWIKEAAPSDELRKRFHADRSQWKAFRDRYLDELEEHREALRPLAERAQNEKVTLVYSVADEEKNNAVVLREYLEMLGEG